jgi:zinc-ribbon domain
VSNTNFCKSCGALLSKEHKFCPECGRALTGPSPQSQPSAATPQAQQDRTAPSGQGFVTAPQEYAAPPQSSLQEPERRLGGAFWLGLVGGVFGILGACVAILVGSFSESLTGSNQDLYALGGGALVFSVLGIVGGALERRKIVGGVLMIVSAVGILISISLFGVLSCILFLIGGILILAKKRIVSTST